MFSLEKEQQEIEISGVIFGGQPGDNPTPLGSTIFYGGHEIIEDREKAKFDRDKAEELVNRQEELSDKTGVPHYIDVFAENEDEMVEYLDFLADITDAPLQIDANVLDVMLAGAEYVKEAGLEDRAIYNSINPWTQEPEREEERLKEIGLKNALILAYNMQDQSAQGRMSILQEGGLLDRAERCGFENCMVDTSVMNLPATGITVLAARQIKNELGVPVGSGPSNATDMWEAPKEWGKECFIGADSAVHAIAATLWNDFLLIGAIENVGHMFPAVAAADSALAGIMFEETGELPEREDHPIRQLFPDEVAALTGKVRKIVIDEELCEQCWVCIEECPSDALSKPESEEGTPILNEEQCTKCETCIEECPQDAISMEMVDMAEA